MSNTNSDSNSDNKLSKKAEGVIQHHQSASIFSHSNPNELIINKPDKAMEYSIKPIPEATKDNSYNFIRKSNQDPNVKASQNQTQWNLLVRQVADRMKNGGTGAISNMPADLSAEGYGKLYAEAAELLQRQKAEADDPAYKKEMFRRRILELSKEPCSACGLVLNTAMNPYAMDSHQEKCEAFQKQESEKRIYEDNRRNFERRIDGLINHGIATGISALGNQADLVQELTFSLTNAQFNHGEKNPAIVEGYMNSKEHFRSQVSNYQRRKLYDALEQGHRYLHTIQAFLDRLDSLEDELAVLQTKDEVSNE